ncbi:MAG TPA: serine hydrolase domain-containing protein [Reyranella sp.]|nr:serine hydrolase domain-containing protein [Reyranella sp.]
MSMRSLASVLVLSLALVPAAVRAEMPAQMAGKPEDVGLSSTQLKRLEAATKKNIDDGLMPGAVMLVARRGKVAWVSVQGKRAPDADDPMKFDSIFRIYSMTKPITSLVLMQLVEEGRLQVYDPVAQYLPEIGKMKVGTEVTVDGRPTLRLGDPERAMTVQDLLRHTAGLTYASRGTSLVHKAYIDAKVGDRTATNEEMVKRLGGVPLLFAPGERWEYSVATDVQGRLIEVLTGKTLMEAFNERVFGPLGMVDTAFQVPAAKLARAAQPGQKPNGPPMTPRFKVDDGAKYESGGGGLLGTTEDYLRFSLALANGGAFQGKRLIGRKTLEFMTADHVGNRPGRPDGFGFGLGFEIHTKLGGDTALMGSVGEYGWSGAAGTTFWVDPKEQLVGIYMVQANAEDTRFLRNQFRSMVQAAIAD